MTLGPDRLTLRRWFMEADKGTSSGGGTGTGEQKEGEQKQDAEQKTDDQKGEQKAEEKKPEPPIEKSGTFKLADGGTKVIIDGVEFVVQSKVNDLVGTAREDGRVKGKEETEAEARAAALKEQGDFKTLYEQEKEKRETAEREREEEKLKTIRANAGAKFGLPQLLIDRLEGKTEKEIEADAEKVSKELGDRKAVDTDSGRGSRTRARTGDGNGTGEGTGEKKPPAQRFAFQKEGDVNWNTGQPIAKTG